MSLNVSIPIVAAKRPLFVVHSGQPNLTRASRVVRDSPIYCLMARRTFNSIAGELIACVKSVEHPNEFAYFDTQRQNAIGRACSEKLFELMATAYVEANPGIGRGELVGRAQAMRHDITRCDSLYVYEDVIAVVEEIIAIIAITTVFAVIELSTATSAEGNPTEEPEADELLAKKDLLRIVMRTLSPDYLRGLSDLVMSAARSLDQQKLAA